MADFTGTAGNDVQNGTNAGDTFDYSQGGVDTLRGKDGDDTFVMGATFTAADSISGGQGHDVFMLAGNYSTAVVFGQNTLSSIEEIVLAAGNTYRLTLAATSVSATGTMRVDASALGAANLLVLDGEDLSQGSLELIGGAGNDTLHGGLNDDTISGGDGNDILEGGGIGTDTVDGGNGNDQIRANAHGWISGGEGNDTITGFSRAPGAFIRSIDAGGGDDTIIFGGIVGSRINLVLQAGALQGGAGTDTLSPGGPMLLDMDVFDAASTGIERLSGGFFVGSDRDNILDFATFAAGSFADLIVKGARGSDVLTAQSTEGSVWLYGGHGEDLIIGAERGDSLFGDAGDDRISGGSGGDDIEGGLGQDRMSGNGGPDIFLISTAEESTGEGYDIIKKFDGLVDKLHCAALPAAIDAAIAAGALSNGASFDSELAAAVNAGNLAAHHAVLFTPDSGTLGGETFLIVDANGVAGYQAGEDQVMGLLKLVHVDAFTVSVFL